MGEEVKVWYDEEGDYLEVLFAHKKWYFRETEYDAVMEKVDEAGNIQGFSILKVSALKGSPPLAVTLKQQPAEPRTGAAPNSLRSCVAPAIGRGSPRAFLRHEVASFTARRKQEKI